jgi:hypothetical protein
MNFVFQLAGRSLLFCDFVPSCDFRPSSYISFSLYGVILSRIEVITAFPQPVTVLAPAPVAVVCVTREYIGG